MKLVTLRKRREYLRVRGGGRWSCPPFVLEAKPREMATPESDEGGAQVAKQDAGPAAGMGTEANAGPRFGFTVTKRLGNAVRRNRIRRRLKAAIATHCTTAARDNFDYVVIARLPAMDMDFSELTGHVARAFEHVHCPRRADEGRRRLGGKR